MEKFWKYFWRILNIFWKLFEISFWKHLNIKKSKIYLWKFCKNSMKIFWTSYKFWKYFGKNFVNFLKYFLIFEIFKNILKICCKKLEFFFGKFWKLFWKCLKIFTKKFENIFWKYLKIFGNIWKFIGENLKFFHKFEIFLEENETFSKHFLKNFLNLFFKYIFSKFWNILEIFFF